MTTESRSLHDTGAPLAPVDRYELTALDAKSLLALADRLLDQVPGKDLTGHLDEVMLASHELPAAIRKRFIDFRLTSAYRGGFVLAGIPLDDEGMGPTPDRNPWENTDELCRVEAVLLLLASLLGDPFSYEAVQHGKLVRDICPFRGDEETQLATSSTGELMWHNEEAFDDLRADWILLLCLRNPQGAATSFARVHDVELDARTAARLRRPEFLVAPDSSHPQDSVTLEPKRVAVLTGDPEFPFVRVDPAFMARDLADVEARSALDALIGGLDRSLQDVVLRPGEVMVIDNFHAVHGRRRFEARYDGADRWLRGVHVTADLRKSAGLRTGRSGRERIPGSVAQPVGPV